MEQAQQQQLQALQATLSSLTDHYKTLGQEKRDNLTVTVPTRPLHKLEDAYVDELIGEEPTPDINSNTGQPVKQDRPSTDVPQWDGQNPTMTMRNWLK